MKLQAGQIEDDLPIEDEKTRQDFYDDCIDDAYKDRAPDFGNIMRQVEQQRRISQADKIYIAEKYLEEGLSRFEEILITLFEGDCKEILDFVRSKNPADSNTVMEFVEHPLFTAYSEVAEALTFIESAKTWIQQSDMAEQQFLQQLKKAWNVQSEPLRWEESEEKDLLCEALQNAMRTESFYLSIPTYWQELSSLPSSQQKILYLANKLGDETLLALLKKTTQLTEDQERFIETLLERYFRQPKISKKGAILFVESAVVHLGNILGKIDQQILELEELRVMASEYLVADANIDGAQWKGRNICVAAPCIHVTQQTIWDVSGKNSTFQFEKSAADGASAGGRSASGDGIPGKPGQPGDPGKPGESGGNVYIFADQIKKSGDLTICSIGGVGSPGQDGGNGGNGSDGKDGINGQIDKSSNDSVKVWNTFIHNYYANIDQWTTLHKREYFEAKCTDGREITANAYSGIGFHQAMLLVKGTCGGKRGGGGQGGKAGHGGLGGKGGEVLFYDLKGSAKKYNITLNVCDGQYGITGNNGKNGKIGQGGKRGDDDAWLGWSVNDSLFWWVRSGKEDKVYGRVVVVETNTEQLKSVWCDYKKKWLSIYQSDKPRNEQNEEKVESEQAQQARNPEEPIRKRAIVVSEALEQFHAICTKAQFNIPNKEIKRRAEQVFQPYVNAREKIERIYAPKRKENITPMRDYSKAQLDKHHEVSLAQRELSLDAEKHLQQYRSGEISEKELIEAITERMGTTDANAKKHILSQFPKHIQPYILGQLVVFEHTLASVEKLADLCYMLMKFQFAESRKDNTKPDAEVFEKIVMLLEEVLLEDASKGIEVLLQHPDIWLALLIEPDITERWQLPPTVQEGDLKKQLQDIHPQFLIAFHEKILSAQETEMPADVVKKQELIYLLAGVPYSAELAKELKEKSLAEWPRVLAPDVIHYRLRNLFSTEIDTPAFSQAYYYLLSLHTTFGMAPIEKLIIFLRSQQNEPISLTHFLPVLKRWYKRKWPFSESLAVIEGVPLSQWEQALSYFSPPLQVRSVEKLIELMQGNPENSPCDYNKCVQIIREIKACTHAGEYEIAHLDTDGIRRWAETFQEMIRREDKEKFVEAHKIEILAVINRAVALFSAEVYGKPYSLRDTQFLSLLLFLQGNVAQQIVTGQGKPVIKVLQQIATGEGKSVIYACMAIIENLRGETVDIETSSIALAQEAVKDLGKLYQLFGISIADLGSSDIEQRKKAYQCQVVYGDIGSFQRDYLLESFYGKTIRGGRAYSIVCLDEVDSLLLDKGTCMLYLSHEIPYLDRLEELYLVIWETVNRFRDRILDLKSRIESIVKESPAIVPAHLKNFVERRLEEWIQRAILARDLEENTEYIIDVDHTETNQGKPANIVIMDNDVGMEQFHSQWGNGFHQFLQLKHERELSPESLKGVFTSNVSFIQKYPRLYGLSGTLGREDERALLAKVYGTLFYTIPSFMPSQFEEEDPVICDSGEEWCSAVAKVAKEKTENGRPVLVVCENIRDLNALEEVLKTSGVQLRVYRHSYDKFDPNVTTNEVLLATNLAGRGLDLRLSEELDKKGGLHVCGTFLPPNLRVEEQAFGRAGRKGQKGSGQFILLLPAVEADIAAGRFGLPEWAEGRVAREKAIRDRNEKKRINEIEQEFELVIKTEEALFQEFSRWYQDMQCRLLADDAEIRSIILEYLVTQWAFWLDIKSDAIKQIASEAEKKALISQFAEFRKDMETQLFFEFDESLNSRVLDINQTIEKVKAPDVLLQLGHCLFKKGVNARRLVNWVEQKKEYARSKKCFERVIQMEPYHAEFAQYYLAAVVLNNQDFVQLDRKDYKEAKTLFKKAHTLLEQRKNHIVVLPQRVQQIAALHTVTDQAQSSYVQQKGRQSQICQMFLDTIGQVCGTPLEPKAFAHFTFGEKILEALWKEFLADGIVKRTHIAKKMREALANPSQLRQLPEYRVIQELYFPQAIVKKLLDLKDKQGITAEDFKGILPSIEDFEKILVNLGILTDRKEESGKVVFQFRANKINWEILSKNKFFRLESEDFQDISEFDDKKAKEIFAVCIQKGLLRANGVVTEQYVDTELLEKQIEKLFPDYPAEVEQIFQCHAPYAMALRVLQETAAQNENYVALEQTGLPANVHVSLYIDLMRHGVIKEHAVALKKDQELGDMDAFKARVKKTVQKIFEKSNGWFSKIGKTVGKVKKTEIQSQCERIGIEPNDVDALWQDLQDKRWLQGNKILCEEVRREQREPLSEKFQKIQDAVWDFLICRRINPDDVVEQAFALLERHVGALKSTKDPKATLIELQSLFESERLFEFGDLLALSKRNGFGEICRISEDMYTFKMILSATSILVFGVAQIVAGAYAEIYTVGVGSYFAGALVGEGVSDILYAMEAFYNGQFSWKDYRKSKLKSVAISLGTAGVAASYASWRAGKEGYKFSRYGFKIAGNIKNAETGKALMKIGGKELLKQKIGAGVGERILKAQVYREVAKRVAVKSAKAVVKGGAYMCVDHIIEHGLQRFNDHLAETIVGEVRTKFDTQEVAEKLKSAMAKLYAKYPDQADQIIQDIIAKKLTLTSNLQLADDIFGYLQMGMTCFVAGKGKAFKTLKKAEVQFDEGMLIQKTAQIMAGIGKWAGSVKGLGLIYRHSCKLVGHIADELERLVDDAEVQPSQEIEKRVKGHVRNLRETIIKQVRQVIGQQLEKPMLRSLADKGVRQGKKWLDKQYRAWEARSHRSEFQKIKTQVKQLAEKKEKAKTDKDKAEIQASEKRIADGYRSLMLKVRDPKLVSELVLAGAPAGPAELFAMAKALKKPIQILGDTKKLQDMGFPSMIPGKSDGTSENEEEAITVYFTADASGIGHFSADPNSEADESNGGFGCFYESIAVQSGHNADELRKAVAETILHDQVIQEHIQKGHFHVFAASGIAGGSDESSFSKPGTIIQSNITAERYFYETDVNNLIEYGRKKGIDAQTLERLKQKYLTTTRNQNDLGKNLQKLQDALKVKYNGKLIDQGAQSMLQQLLEGEDPLVEAAKFSLEMQEQMLRGRFNTINPSEEEERYRASIEAQKKELENRRYIANKHRQDPKRKQAITQEVNQAAIEFKNKMVKNPERCNDFLEEYADRIYAISIQRRTNDYLEVVFGQQLGSRVGDALGKDFNYEQLVKEAKKRPNPPQYIDEFIQNNVRVRITSAARGELSNKYNNYENLLKREKVEGGSVLVPDETSMSLGSFIGLIGDPDNKSFRDCISDDPHRVEFGYGVEDSRFGRFGADTLDILKWQLKEPATAAAQSRLVQMAVFALILKGGIRITSDYRGETIEIGGVQVFNRSPDRPDLQPPSLGNASRFFVNKPSFDKAPDSAHSNLKDASTKQPAGHSGAQPNTSSNIGDSASVEGQADEYFFVYFGTVKDIADGGLGNADHVEDGHQEPKIFSSRFINQGFILTQNKNGKMQWRNPKGQFSSVEQLVNQVGKKSEGFKTATVFGPLWGTSSGSVGPVDWAAKPTASLEGLGKGTVGIELTAEIGGGVSNKCDMANPLSSLCLVNPEDNISIEYKVGAVAKAEANLDWDSKSGKGSIQLKFIAQGGLVISTTVPILHTRYCNIDATGIAVQNSGQGLPFDGFIVGAELNASINNGKLYVKGTRGFGTTGVSLNVEINAKQLILDANEIISFGYEKCKEQLAAIHQQTLEMQAREEKFQEEAGISQAVRFINTLANG